MFRRFAFGALQVGRRNLVSASTRADMNSKILRPFARSILLAAIFSRFAATFTNDETEPFKAVPNSLEGKACKLCGG